MFGINFISSPQQAEFELCTTPDDCCTATSPFRFDSGQKIGLTSMGLAGSCLGFTLNAIQPPHELRMKSFGSEPFPPSTVYFNTWYASGSFSFPEVPAGSIMPGKGWVYSVRYR